MVRHLSGHSVHSYLYRKYIKRLYYGPIGIWHDIIRPIEHLEY